MRTEHVVFQAWFPYSLCGSLRVAQFWERPRKIMKDQMEARLKDRQGLSATQKDPQRLSC